MSVCIAYGVIAGILSYVLLNGVPWALRKATNNRISPPSYNQAEQWVIPPGSIVPAWMSMLLALVSGRSRSEDVPMTPQHQHQFRTDSMDTSQQDHDHGIGRKIIDVSELDEK
ncbi:hypothetical protein EVG20_g8106 [Dentipellis fragilis]|uniref:Uncharacterized protein n=1 Tax=Dentipellis fragilis TaxID=205917 RepID=A0A4Y9YAG8_9AGAM|nr:hypothetical protein EVG20_g8106 [Dentipellis fragilis]